MSRQDLYEERAKNNKILKNLARTRLQLEDTLEKPERYKTLYYGLRVNHERNVAVIHPLMFMFRRIIYALVIVYMDRIHIFGVLVFMLCTMIMLAYVLTEFQWKERSINL